MHRVAALLCRRVRVLLLGILLNLIAGVATRARTRNGRQGLAASAADLMPQDAANQRVNSGTNQTVLIFDWLRMRDLFVVAFLSRNPDRSRQWLGAGHPCRMSRLIHVVAGYGTTRDHHKRARKRSRHQ